VEVARNLVNGEIADFRDFKWQNVYHFGRVGVQGETQKVGTGEKWELRGMGVRNRFLGLRFGLESGWAGWDRDFPDETWVLSAQYLGLFCFHLDEGDSMAPIESR
jgi:hypothetical protein